MITVLVGSSPNAVAAPTPVTIDDRTPSLTETDGGGWTVELGFTNLTNAPIELLAQPRDDDPGCEPKPLPDLPGAEHTDVTVELPDGCDVPADGVDLELVASPADGGPVAFPVTAAPKPDATDPDWDHLLFFPISLIPAFVVLGVAAYLTLRPPTTEEGRHSMFKGLPSLKTAWGADESWASNVTVIGGLLSALLVSSDVPETVFGEDADPSVALALIGTAVAAALAGAAALIAVALRAKGEGDQAAEHLYTPFGLVLAGAVTVAAAGGELWVVSSALQALDLGWFDSWLGPATWVMEGLLLVYAVRSLQASIQSGLVQPPEPDAGAGAAQVPIQSVRPAALL